jgi:hypothetical protein
VRINLCGLLNQVVPLVNKSLLGSLVPGMLVGTRLIHKPGIGTFSLCVVLWSGRR